MNLDSLSCKHQKSKLNDNIIQLFISSPSDALCPSANRTISQTRNDHKITKSPFVTLQIYIPPFRLNNRNPPEHTNTQRCDSVQISRLFQDPLRYCGCVNLFLSSQSGIPDVDGIKSFISTFSYSTKHLFCFGIVLIIFKWRKK